MIAKFAKKINEILIQKEIVQKEDAELYQYGIENGIVLQETFWLLELFWHCDGGDRDLFWSSVIYASLRSYSGGSHCKSRIG